MNQKTTKRKSNISITALVSLFIMAGLATWSLIEHSHANKEKIKAQANNFNYLAEEVAEEDPTVALRLAEYALSLDSTNENIKDNLRNIYYANNFYKIFKGEENLYSSVTFSPDGKKILIGSDNNILRLWDLDGNMLQVFKGREDKHSYSVYTKYSVAFSPDGKRIMAGSYSQEAQLWDLDGNVLQVFNGPEERSSYSRMSDPGVISSGVFSPDGKFVLTGSLHNHTALLWEIEGNELQVFILV